MLNIVFIVLIIIVVIPLAFFIKLFISLNREKDVILSLIIYSILLVLCISTFYFICYHEKNSPQKININQLDKIDFTGMKPSDLETIFKDYNIKYYNEKKPFLSYPGGSQIIMATFSHKTERCIVYYCYSEKIAKDSYESLKNDFKGRNAVFKENENNRYLITKIGRNVGDWGELLKSYNGSIDIQSGNVNLNIIAFNYENKEEVTRRNNKIVNDIVDSIQEYKNTK